MQTTKRFFMLLTFSMMGWAAVAQQEAPKGYVKGSVTLNDQTKLGWIKEDFAGAGSIQFTENGSKKVKLSGMDIQSINIDSNTFIAIKGDIFKVLSSGSLSLLQKYTHVAGKPYYNCNETVLMEGTEGKKGDYFLYLQKQNKLKLVSSKTSVGAYTEFFQGNELASEKASKSNGDPEQLKEAVVLFNNQNK